jgi:hypothetical protein
MWHVHLVKYDSALKGRKFRCIPPMNDPWKHCAVWSKLVTKNRYCVILLLWQIYKGGIHRAREYSGAFQVSGGDLGVCLKSLKTCHKVIWTYQNTFICMFNHGSFGNFCCISFTTIWNIVSHFAFRNINNNQEEM